MEDIHQFLYTNELFAHYGSLLTHKQQEVMKLYYHYNLSLQEIADNLSISRAAVSDTLKKATAHLQRYEQHLGVHAKFKQINTLVAMLEHEQSNQALLDKIKKELE